MWQEWRSCIEWHTKKYSDTVVFNAQSCTKEEKLPLKLDVKTRHDFSARIQNWHKWPGGYHVIMWLLKNVSSCSHCCSTWPPLSMTKYWNASIQCAQMCVMQLGLTWPYRLPNIQTPSWQLFNSQSGTWALKGAPTLTYNTIIRFISFTMLDRLNGSSVHLSFNTGKTHWLLR